MIRLKRLLNTIAKAAQYCCKLKIMIGKNPNNAAADALILFPYHPNRLCCGMTSMVALNRATLPPQNLRLVELIKMVEGFERRLQTGMEQSVDIAVEQQSVSEIEALLQQIRSFKQEAWFSRIFHTPGDQAEITALGRKIDHIVKFREAFLKKKSGSLEISVSSAILQQLENLKDAAWCLNVEIMANLEKIRALMGEAASEALPETTLAVYKKINAALNSLDRLEVRGRDSAGISLLITLDHRAFDQFLEELKTQNRLEELNRRAEAEVLVNGGISIRKIENGMFSVAMTYKIAAEVGKLGDNVAFLRGQIRIDPIFQTLVKLPCVHYSISAHTRWASVGAISEPNCHPVDNRAGEPQRCMAEYESAPAYPKSLIHVCLNGDIDNHLALKSEMEQTDQARIHEDITTDTKIIPLRIEHYLNQGVEITEAFRLAVNDFHGSHAISMHTDLAPGKLFLAQKGSGQAIFIGLAPDHYMATSEVYGFVEDTDQYLKLDGEKQVQGKQGLTSGQIVILSPDQRGGLHGVKAMYYDGSPVQFSDQQIKKTLITSRDIDRQQFPHYFLKEISESPASVEKTLQHRWKTQADRCWVSLDESVAPEIIKTAFRENKIRRIFFIGQGTAGVAALACANLFAYYLNDPSLVIAAYKSSELSGFNLTGAAAPGNMRDTLVVAVTQSGTTTDTNRAVDMAREFGAYTLAIVNRRDSDITFKVNGVMYTSSGRDIEMSVASTKAFYSQIMAGALLGLYFAGLSENRNDAFITHELQSLLRIPEYMRQILTMKETIKQSADRLSPKKIYWATVGSGPNKAAADEIRIKLSELCYKTISSDYVEDKKHIDLSSEPLIMVCAAGSRNTVIGDIIKDTAIFRAHKAAPVVIADEDELRFEPYAESVFHVPRISEHLSPLLNTLVGHLWGYYAALAINDSSKFIYDFRESIKKAVADCTGNGLDVYELILEKSFREQVAVFYIDLKRKFGRDRFSSSVSLVSDLILLLKYMTGKLPVADFELDFDRKGTAVNILNAFFETTGEIIAQMSRPVDAIKHQAKTVTVGTSRLGERLTGLLFDFLLRHQISESQLTPSNVIVLRNLQKVVEKINGSILYRIDGLTLLGETTEQTTIRIVARTGMLETIPSRVEIDPQLKGTKKIIVRQGNVYIGKGRRDDRSILIIPVMSDHKDAPNIIEHLLLLNIQLNVKASLDDKIKALGGKYEHIKNIVQENSVAWRREHLEYIHIEELFGRSAEKVAETIQHQITAHKSE